MSTPLKKTMLGVSLIHGQFRALSVVKGQTTASWVCPDRIESFDHLGLVLAQAVRETGFPGSQVGFLLEDEQCVHQYHLVPPMKTADLEVYLARMADQEKVCEGQAVWRYRKSQSGHGRTGFLLDVWPKQHVDQLIEACTQQQLTPIQLFPLSAIFVDQVQAISAEPEEVVLLVTQAWDKVVFVVATGDGKPLFDRFLMSDAGIGLDHERIGREVARSMLFAMQQLGKRVSQVWVMAEGESLTAEGLQPHVTVPVFPSPIQPDPAYWIWVTLTLSSNHPFNFIPKEVRKAPQRRVVKKLTAGLMVGLACLSVSATGFIEAMVNQGQKLTSSIEHSTKELIKDRDRWQQRHADMADLRMKVELAQALHHPPVPGWFVGYVAEVLPPGLVLKKMAVRRETNSWLVSLKGYGLETVPESARLLAAFEQELREGPFHLRFTKGWKESWMNNLRRGVRPNANEESQAFELEGRIG